MQLRISRPQLLVVFLALVVLLAWPARAVLIRVDRQYFDESVRGIYGRYLAGEDWSDVPSLPSGLSYDWLESESQLLRIGHALGGVGSELANDLSALPLTSLEGLKVLEVDISMHNDGSLRCFHGPGDSGPLLPQTCTFARLVRATADSGEYLVLDIKTDFAITSERIAAELRETPSERRRIVFQLYRPADFATFHSLDGVRDLAGPIVTAYVARSSLARVIAGASGAGVKVVAVPLQRLAALGELPAGMRVLVHPVHDCDAYAVALRAHANGVYVPSGLQCSS
jgi:hypothetical protein